MAKLTAKQHRFVDEYLVDLNATQAAIRAGYSAATAAGIGAQNLKKPQVAAEIESRRAELAANVHVTQERIVEEYAKLAFANMQDYITITDDGFALVDLSKLTSDQAAAIAEIIVDEYTDGRGEDAREVKKVRLKLADKKSALDSLAKHLGMFRERLEHSGPNGGPISLAKHAIDLSALSDDDLDAAIAQAANARVGKKSA